MGSRLSLQLGATAVVCCVHGAEKRAVTELAYDAARERVDLCPCCENCYAVPLSQAPPPPLCPPCSQTSLRGRL